MAFWIALPTAPWRIRKANAMKTMFVAAVAAVLMMVGAAQAGTIHYDLVGTSETTWDLNVTVSGEDTAGLGGFSVTSLSATPSTFAFNVIANKNAGTEEEPYYLVGFTLQSVEVFETNTVAGASQDGATRVLNVGKAEVNVQDPWGGSAIVLGTPAYMGTLTTAAGLTAQDFAFNGTLFKTAPTSNNDVLAADATEISSTVTPYVIPEPATMALLGLGGLAMLKRRG